MPNASDLHKLLDLRYEWEHSEIEEKPEREKLYLTHFDAAYREAATVKPSLSRHAFWMRWILFTTAIAPIAGGLRWEPFLHLSEARSSQSRSCGAWDYDRSFLRSARIIRS